MNDVAAVQAKLNQKFKTGMSSLAKGTCISIDWVAGTALVNIPGGNVDMPMVGGAPIPNARCWVGFLGNLPICLGAVTRPPLATVSGAASGGLITVTSDDGEDYPVTFTAGATFTTGDRVLIDWTFSTIVALPQADPNTGEPITDGGTIGGGGQQSRVFYPGDSGTWRDGTFASGWLRGELWDSDHNHGAYFYAGIADTIPDNASVQVFQVFMGTTGGYGGNPTLGGHALGGMGPDLSVSAARPFNPNQGWVDISDLFDYFKTGALLGVGTAGGGNWHFGGAGGNNGAINAVWST